MNAEDPYLETYEVASHIRESSDTQETFHMNWKIANRDMSWSLLHASVKVEPKNVWQSTKRFAGYFVHGAANRFIAACTTRV